MTITDDELLRLARKALGPALDPYEISVSGVCVYGCGLPLVTASDDQPNPREALHAALAALAGEGGWPAARATSDAGHWIAAVDWRPKTTSRGEHVRRGE